MKTYAVLDNNSNVTNIIVASSLDVAESVTNSFCALIPLGTFVNIGYLYANGEFIDPNPPVEITPEENPS